MRLEPAWVPRDENVCTDYIIKLAEVYDWALKPTMFYELDLLCFASNENNQIARFNSCFWCLGTEAVDGFTCDWHQENNWLCPPPALIPRLIRHMRNCGAVGTLILPRWESAPFWPLVCPDGLGFADFVVGWLVLPSDKSIFFAGQAEAYGVWCWSIGIPSVRSPNQFHLKSGPFSLILFSVLSQYELVVCCEWLLSSRNVHTVVAVPGWKFTEDTISVLINHKNW